MKQPVVIGKFIAALGMTIAATLGACSGITYAIGFPLPLGTACGFAIALFLFNSLVLLLYLRLLQMNAKTATLSILVAKVIRMLLCVLFIVGYAVLSGDSLLPLIVTTLSLYLATMVQGSVFYVRLEKQIKEIV